MDLELVAAATINLCATYQNYLAVYRRHTAIKKRTRKRRFWMQAMHQERTGLSLNDRLSELLTEPTGQYFIHMSSTDFEYLLQKISPIIKKKNTSWRDSIPAKIRLAVTLRFLATGDSFSSLHRYFKISTSLICRIVPEVCQAITVVLKDLVRLPTSAEEWLSKSKKFRFPHCVGALDGKHVLIWSPAHLGPEDANYQGTYSIVLLTLVDNDSSFMYIEAMQSSNSDNSVFTQSDLWDRICTNSLNLPYNPSLPYVFVTNGTFPLSEKILKPFNGVHPVGSPENLFNSYLKDCHSVTDNAFGLISSVFKVLNKSIHLDPSKCTAIIKSCLFLHNFLIKSDCSRDIYAPPGSLDIYEHGEMVTQGSWRQEKVHFLPLQTLTCLPDENALQMRMNFLDNVCRNSFMYI